MSEKSTQTEILLALGSRPDVRLWRNTVGEGWQGVAGGRDRGTYTLRPGDVVLRNARYVTFGLAPGSWDLVGVHRQIIMPADVGQAWGRLLGIEVKTDNGRLRSDQIRFHAALQRFDVLQGVARNISDATSVLPY